MGHLAEWRCVGCGHKLAEHDLRDGTLEIRCPRSHCRMLNRLVAKLTADAVAAHQQAVAAGLTLACTPLTVVVE